jgi:hypothetical protein
MIEGPWEQEQAEKWRLLQAQEMIDIHAHWKVTGKILPSTILSKQPTIETMQAMDEMESRGQS